MHPYYFLGVIKERNNRGKRKRTKNSTHYNVENFPDYINGNEANVKVAEVHNKTKMLEKRTKTTY